MILYDYIVANHRIMCSVANHKDLHFFPLAGLEVAAGFGRPKWPSCRLGSGATEDPGIYSTWESAKISALKIHFLDFLDLLKSADNHFLKRSRLHWPFLCVFTQGFQEASLVSPSQVCNGRRIDLQAGRALTQNMFETTYQHPKHTWPLIRSFFRFRLGSTSGYDSIMFDSML